MHVSNFKFINDLYNINSCFFEEGCICFCLHLQTVGLVSQASPFPFCSVNHFQYSIRDQHCGTERVWLVRLTCGGESFTIKTGLVNVAPSSPLLSISWLVPPWKGNENNLHDTCYTPKFSVYVLPKAVYIIMA